MKPNVYTSRDESIQHNILGPLEACGENPGDYDIQAIADQVLGDHSHGYMQTVVADTFWQVVEANHVG